MLLCTDLFIVGQDHKLGTHMDHWKEKDIFCIFFGLHQTCEVFQEHNRNYSKKYTSGHLRQWLS